MLKMSYSMKMQGLLCFGVFPITILYCCKFLNKGVKFTIAIRIQTGKFQ